ncbi:MAG TPA: NAD(P)-binding domain-containing protein [Chitinophagales bacterium]|nr:NAD(P)-binding domain-containing protein [Chitinophagales bacterium]
MKKIGVLGTGAVGATIGRKLITLGYEVMMGSRTKGNAKAVAWVNEHTSGASEGTFADAVQFGDIIFNCTKGEITLEALKLAGIENFNGKTVVDVSNPLDFSKGMPPSLLICNTNSLGEEVQKLLPGANVVKALNTVNCEVMVDAKKPGAEGTMLICGNNAQAKEEVQQILWQFGWTDILDIGDIKGARSLEMLVITWVSVMQTLKTANFAFKVARS